MTTLVPRLWTDMTEWFEQDLMPHGPVMRLEDQISEGKYTIRAELPGVDPDKDVQVSVEHGVLTIHAERREETKTKHRSEFRYGVAERSVRLPASADPEQVKANYGNGILEVTIPLKTTEPTAKRVPIAKA